MEPLNFGEKSKLTLGRISHDISATTDNTGKFGSSVRPPKC